MYSETNLLFQRLIDHAFAFKKKKKRQGEQGALLLELVGVLDGQPCKPTLGILQLL